MIVNIITHVLCIMYILQFYFIIIPCNVRLTIFNVSKFQQTHPARSVRTNISFFVNFYGRCRCQTESRTKECYPTGLFHFIRLIQSRYVEASRIKIRRVHPSRLLRLSKRNNTDLEEPWNREDYGAPSISRAYPL